MSSSWLLETRPIGDCMAVEISGAGLRCWMEGYDGGSGAAAAAAVVVVAAASAARDGRLRFIN